MDGQGLVLCLMDGLRNGPYRMCHTASGDVLMRCRGEGPLQQDVRRDERGKEAGRAARQVRTTVFESIYSRRRRRGRIVER